MKRSLKPVSHNPVTRPLAVFVLISIFATLLLVGMFKVAASNSPARSAVKRAGAVDNPVKEAKTGANLNGVAAGYLQPPTPLLGTCDTGSPVEVEATAGTLGPTGYSNFNSAFTAINSGTHQGTINIEICNNVIEGVATLNASGAGSASYGSVNIRPVGGVARTISNSNPGSPIINLNGADNVTIDGLNTGGNALTISNSSSSSNFNTSTIRFIGDASNNTIQNCTIVGSGTNTSSGTILFSTGTTTGNDGNTISNNSIGPAIGGLPQNAICSVGTSAAVDNSGNTISNNNIFDFQGNSISTSAAIALTTGNSTWAINNNKIFQTGTRTYVSGNLQTAIRVNSGDGYTINGNTIGFASAAGTGTYTMNGNVSTRFNAIDLAVGNTTATNVQNNTIGGFSLTTTTSSDLWIGINVQSGNVNIGSVTGNTIGSTSGTGSVVVTSSGGGLVMGINSSSSGTVAIQNNSIGGLDSLSSAPAQGPSVIGIQNAGTGGSYNISNNTVGNATANNMRAGTSGVTTGGTTVKGISNGATGTVSVTGNIVRNLTSYGPSAFTGITRGIENSDGTVSGNSISTIVSASGRAGTNSVSDAAIVGLALNGSSATQLIESNTISALRSTAPTATTVVIGIGIDNSTFGGNVRRNKIFDLTNVSTGAGATIAGLHLYSSGAWTASNNMISLTNGANTNAVVLRGIYDNNAFSTSVNYYFNSVNIGGSAASGSQNSYGFWRTANAAPGLRNNILNNVRTGGTGKHYAVANANPTGWNASTSNYNVLNSSTAATVGLWGAVDQTFATWKTASGGDLNSFSGVTVTFVDAANGDLRLNFGLTPTVLESGGTAAGGITIDQEGNSRPGPAGSVNGGAVAPDLGADEFDGVPLDLVPPTITYAALTNTASTANRVVSTTITDLFGVASGANAPRVYYRKNAGSYFSNQCGAPTGSVYPCTIDVSLVSGVVLGDSISYFVIAQDSSNNVSSNPGAGLVASSVNSVTTPPTTPNTYSIVVAIGGTKTVCASGCDYTNLTGTGGAFADINAKAVTSNLEIQIAGNLTVGENGVNALNSILDDPTGSNFTVKIYPTGAPRVISGASTGSPEALVRLRAADRVTIDGSLGGVGTDRSLTITNTGGSTTSAVIWLQSNGADGTTANTIKNLNVVGSNATLFGIGMGGSTISTSSLGAGNNFNTIQNNSISKATWGIFSQGTSVASKNTGNVITQNLMNTVSPNHVRVGGIRVGFENSLQITQNTVSEIISNSSGEDLFGISLGMNGLHAISYSGNEVTNALVSRNVIGIIRQTLNSSACGICVVPATSGTNQISNNTMTGVSSNASSADFTAGILIGGGTGSITQVYFNSVSMNGSQGGSNNKSYALAIGGSNPTVDVRDNVLYNTQATTTNGVSYAVGYDYSTFTNLTSNYNDLFVGGGATFSVGGTGSFNSPTSRLTLTDLQTATSKDANSLSVDPMFVSATANLVPQAASPVLDAGTSLSGNVSPYIDMMGASRTDPATIGAYESAADLTAPLITYSSLSSTPLMVSRPLDVTITDAGGIALGANAPRLYYRKNGGAWVSTQCGAPTVDIYPCMIDHSLVGGVTANDLVEYFGVAQDTSNNLNANPSAGFTATSVNSILSAPSAPTSYLILAPTAAAASIRGRIDAGSQPVSGVTVTVVGGARVRRAITDANGSYKVDGLEAGGFYTVTPGHPNYLFTPASRSLSLVASNTEAAFAGSAIVPDTNPLESPEFFVRQQYLDFLGREPDQAGLDYWSDQLRACGDDLSCRNVRRIGVSAAFFIEQEFQDSGLFVYDLYQGALARRPSYAEYSADRKHVVGGSGLEEDKTAFATGFVDRAEFVERYPLTMTADVFVDALLRTAQQSSGVDFSSERANLLALYDTGATTSESRRLVLRSLVEGDSFRQTQRNSAFVLMEYFGYLGRNPDAAGYNFWLTVLNDRVQNNYHSMVCAFVTSMEYQRRFSAIASHSNAECGQ
jgi:trimeric autotransporter adhesin